MPQQQRCGGAVLCVFFTHTRPILDGDQFVVVADEPQQLTVPDDYAHFGRQIANKPKNRLLFVVPME